MHRNPGVRSKPDFGLLGWKPVKRGLVKSPEQWRWSSYRFYLLREPGLVKVNKGWGKISFRKKIA